MREIESDSLPTAFETFGIECGKGWLPLIDPLVDYIAAYNRDKPQEEHIHIRQIKQKLGGLRFYTNFTDETLKHLIKQAANKSFHICEQCGAEKTFKKELNEPSKDQEQNGARLNTLCKNCLA